MKKAELEPSSAWEKLRDLFVERAVATFGYVAAGAQTAGVLSIGNTEKTILLQFRLLIRDSITHFLSLHKLKLEFRLFVQTFLQLTKGQETTIFPYHLLNIQQCQGNFKSKKAFFSIFFRFPAQKNFFFFETAARPRHDAAVFAGVREEPPEQNRFSPRSMIPFPSRRLRCEPPRHGDRIPVPRAPTSGKYLALYINIIAPGDFIKSVLTSRAGKPVISPAVRA